MLTPPITSISQRSYSKYIVDLAALHLLERRNMSGDTQLDIPNGDLLDVGQQYPDVVPRDEFQDEVVKHGGSHDGAVQQQIIAFLLSWGRNKSIVVQNTHWAIAHRRYRFDQNLGSYVNGESAETLHFVLHRSFTCIGWEGK